jgi:two-component system, chemotaxis family, sensor kinase CheA
LLRASGYAVSFDEADREQASVILATNAADSDDRALRLRSSVHGIGDHRPSIYRYDRMGLLSAIEAKLAGAL